MDDESIRLIVEEIAPLLTGRAAGKIFQLGRTSLAFDFGLRDAGYLYLNADPAAPRIYLIKRRARDLEKESRPLTQFALSVKKALEYARLVSVAKDRNDRIVRFHFTGKDQLGKTRTPGLVAQLTGRSANLFLLDEEDTVMQALRPSSTAGQRVGDPYTQSGSARTGDVSKPTDLLELIQGQKFRTASQAADHYFTSLLAEKDRAARIASARANLRKKISQQQRLLRRLQNDQREHRNPEHHKRIGDLLLANLKTAKRKGNRVTLVDYFADDAPVLELEIESSVSLQEEAARRFECYSKSKRALEQINLRVQSVLSSLRELESEQRALEERIAGGDVAGFADKSADSAVRAAKQLRLERERIPGTRRYVSSDGFEILVGRTAQNNDQLTFKIAKPNDLWLHAADYGGSHVVIRNSTRKQIPQRTLIEAAQLAAYFSQAKKDPKVDVLYTERKFVTKPKGVKPGLVRLQRFKNITVEAKEAATRVSSRSQNRER